jgi:tRNA modification GTPase
LIAINKVDLQAANLDLPEPFISNKSIRISAKNGLGLKELQECIIAPFLPNDFDESNFLISDARHFDLLVRATNEIQNSVNFIGICSEEIVLIGLHNAMRFLDEITGETTTEDILTRIFSTFCIGK